MKLLPLDGPQKNEKLVVISSCGYILQITFQNFNVSPFIPFVCIYLALQSCHLGSQKSSKMNFTFVCTGYLKQNSHCCQSISTLESGINVQSGIRVRVGSFRENNKHTVWNKHIKGKFQSIHYQKCIKKQQNQQFSCNFSSNIRSYRSELSESINVRSEIRAVRVGKSFKINKRTGTFISDSRVSSF